jgi:uncharacterized protein YqcC (DUF446 family)
MSLSNQVEDNLKEAEGCLRNALHWSAKNEKPFVSREISDMICRIDTLRKTDQLLDKLENRMNGNGDDKGTWGTFFS